VISWNASSVKILCRGKPGVLMDSLWLRDACPCPRCVDPDSGQKIFSTTDLPDKPKVSRAFMNADGSLQVEFANDVLSGGATHNSVFPAAEVQSWVGGATGIRGVFSAPLGTIPWNTAMYQNMMAEGSCLVSYKDWTNKSSPAFWTAMADLSKTGLIIVTDVPQVENEVENVAKQIGPLQYTFYGWTWDVKSKPRAENVAYTSQFLGLHQDLMYHTPIPKIQLLHCLENSCEGGESLFSHGVRAAHELRLAAPAHYQTLVSNPTHFAYLKNGHHYFQRHSTINESIKGYPSSTYWAPPFQTTFRKRSGPEFATLAEWKTAATAFQKIVEDPANMIQLKLKPGQCVIFDNRRVLHGRREFATAEGSRWLKGCYVEPQVFYAMETRLAEHLKHPPLTAKQSLRLAEKEAQLVKETMP
ncbi:Clavaminate synthase-like protein, partial [Trichocladium antarcticum]